jgi:hypothetical protein
MDKSTGPLTFAASFPRDAQFAPTMGELASKLAQTTGCAESACQEIRAAVGAAFEAALASEGSSDIELALGAAGEGFVTAVTCGGRPYLTLTHPRSA